LSKLVFRIRIHNVSDYDRHNTNRVEAHFKHSINLVVAYDVLQQNKLPLVFLFV